MTEKIKCPKCGEEFNNYHVTSQICDDENIYEYRCPFCRHILEEYYEQK